MKIDSIWNRKKIKPVWFVQFRAQINIKMKTNSIWIWCSATSIHSFRTKLDCAALTIHFSFIGENDFSSPTRWIDGESFLKTLFNVGAPDAFGISWRQVFVVIAHITDIEMFIDSKEIDWSQLTSRSRANRCPRRSNVGGSN